MQRRDVLRWLSSGVGAGGVAFAPSRGQFGAQSDEVTDRLGQIVVDLIGPVVERAIESRDCRAARSRTHSSTLSVRRK